MNEIEKNSIKTAHNLAVGAIKDELVNRMQQEVDFSNVAHIYEGNQLHPKDEMLKAYKQILDWIAKAPLMEPQAHAIVANAKKQLKEKLEDIKNGLLASQNVNNQSQKEEFGKFFDEKTKQLCDSLVNFSPSVINTEKAKLSLHQEQLKNKKTDEHLSATAFDSKSFSPDPLNPVNYDYKIDIDNLRLQIKHNLANLKPGEKLHIDVEIPPDRADILKKVAETGFQYRNPFVALLLLIFIQINMIKKDDQTRTLSAIADLIKKDHIPLHAENITFAIKARGHDGKLQTVLESRPLDPAIVAWKLSKPLQDLNNILSTAMGMDKQKDQPQENNSHSNCREPDISLNNNNVSATRLVS